MDLGGRAQRAKILNSTSSYLISLFEMRPISYICDIRDMSAPPHSYLPTCSLKVHRHLYLCQMGTGLGSSPILSAISAHPQLSLSSSSCVSVADLYSWDVAFPAGHNEGFVGGPPDLVGVRAQSSYRQQSETCYKGCLFDPNQMCSIGCQACS